MRGLLNKPISTSYSFFFVSSIWSLVFWNIFQKLLLNITREKRRVFFLKRMRFKVDLTLSKIKITKINKFVFLQHFNPYQVLHQVHLKVNLSRFYFLIFQIIISHYLTVLIVFVYLFNISGVVCQKKGSFIMNITVSPCNLTLWWPSATSQTYKKKKVKKYMFTQPKAYLLLFFIFHLYLYIYIPNKVHTFFN